MEVCAFPAAGPGFRPPRWAVGVGYKGSLLGCAAAWLRSLRDAQAAAVQARPGPGACPSLIVRAPRRSVRLNSRSVSFSSGY